MPRASRRPRVDFARVRSVLGFAGGIGGITFFGMILVQMDKVVLSKLLSLEAFGYYMVAATAVNGLQLVIRPIFTAYFPRLSELVARSDEGSVRAAYHEGSQLMALLVFPAAAVLALFSREVLIVWTQSPEVAAQAAPIVAALIVGTAINGVMHLPYALQLASGWTSIGLAITVGMVALLLPLLLVVASDLGGVGAAAVWTGLNLAYLLVGLPWTHARLLKGEAMRWLAGVGRPLVVAFASAALLRLALGRPESRLASAAMVLVAALVAFGAAFAASAEGRDAVWRLLGRRPSPAR